MRSPSRRYASGAIAPWSRPPRFGRDVGGATPYGRLLRVGRAGGLVVAALVGCALGSPSFGTGALSAQQPVVTEDFPHLAHGGLFPLCAGCHEGIPAGNPADAYPDPASCDGCHDGVDERRVSWTPEPRPDDLVAFEHPAHAAEVAREGEPELECAACHVAEEGPRMAVVPLEAERCLACHGDPPASHFTPAQECTSCHVPLASTETGETLLGAVPEPADHEQDDFIFEHGETLGRGEGAGGGLSADVARCATCHVQERCASCHVDPSLGPIRALPPAPAAWTLPPMPAHYPVPPSHADRDFERTHGDPPPEPADCSTCHTRNDCAACHIAPLPPSAEALPPRPSGAGSRIHRDPAPGGEARPQEASSAQGGAAGPQEARRGPQVRGPGVGLEARLPASHETPFFMTAHPTIAAASPETCASCHTETFCASCHDQPRTPGYHPPDFALRHASSVSAASMDCANCHNTQAFCRQCHLEVGFQTGAGRLGRGYHDAEPVWLLRHGQAARQGLEQCASCHTQRECLQCHSQFGAFKVNPHGPDFDPERARERNPWICSACHIGGFGGGS